MTPTHRRPIRRSGPTARQALLVVAIGALAGSAAFWWRIERALTANVWVATAYAVILTLAPPALMAFLLPWSPAGMLLARVRARTWGTAVVVLCALILVRYAIGRQMAWWATQPVVADSGLVGVQVLVGLIGFVLIPALVWAPVTSDELVVQIQQAQLVQRYELQTQADLALLRATLLRAQTLAQVGIANLSPEEQHELATTFRGLVRGIGTTLDGLAASVTTVSGVAVPRLALHEQAVVQDALRVVEEVLVAPESATAPRRTKVAVPAEGPTLAPMTTRRRATTTEDGAASVVQGRMAR